MWNCLWLWLLLLKWCFKWRRRTVSCEYWLLLYCSDLRKASTKDICLRLWRDSCSASILAMVLFITGCSKRRFLLPRSDIKKSLLLGSWFLIAFSCLELRSKRASWSAVILVILFLVSLLLMLVEELIAEFVFVNIFPVLGERWTKLFLRMKIDVTLRRSSINNKIFDLTYLQRKCNLKLKCNFYVAFPTLRYYHSLILESFCFCCVEVF